MVKVAEKAKNQGGQPTKYKPEYAKKTEELCREKGYTDKNLAAHFKVSETTINNWKRRYLEFFESIKKGVFGVFRETINNIKANPYK